MALHARTSVFSDEQILLLKDRVFQLLRDNGARLKHPVVLQKLADAGALVDKETQRVRFPAQFLERVIQQAPGQFVLGGQDVKHDLKLPCPDGTFYTRSGTGAPFYLDPRTGQKRSITLPDVVDWARLGDGLNGIDFMPFPSPSDAPGQTADIHALRVMLKNTAKHVWVQPYSAESIEILIELATTVAGGAKAMEGRPRVSFITCSLTPLDFKYMDLEVMVQACPRGIPVHACSLPSAGTTSPVTMPGTLLLTAAEILTMLAVAQTLCQGAPVVGTPLVFAGNMVNGASLQSSAEAIQGKAATVEFVKKAYAIPTHTYGWGSDAPAVGAQSGIESTLLAATIAAAGGDILGGAGQLEVATALSPLQLVIDEEVAGILRKLNGGLALDDETMAWEELLATGPGANFLAGDHTFRHCRDALAQAAFTRETWEQWRAAGSKDLSARAMERYESIVKGKGEQDLPTETARELDRIVEGADRRLVK